MLFKQHPGVKSKMRKIEYVVSDEKLITQSELSLFGQVLGKSKYNQKNTSNTDRETLSTTNQKRRYFADNDRTSVTWEV
jgi:hypothetical protein